MIYTYLKPYPLRSVNGYCSDIRFTCTNKFGCTLTSTTGHTQLQKTFNPLRSDMQQIALHRMYVLESRSCFFLSSPCV